jgi:hypothetical protein
LTPLGALYFVLRSGPTFEASREWTIDLSIGDRGPPRGLRAQPAFPGARPSPSGTATPCGAIFVMLMLVMLAEVACEGLLATPA